VFFAQPQHKFDVNHGNLIPRAKLVVPRHPAAQRGCISTPSPPAW
jgi:hypothetical protein